MAVYRTRLMTDEQTVEKALHWMMENVTKLAQATANRKYLDDYKKVKHSTLMLAAPKGTDSYKKAWASAHDDYDEVLKGLKISVEEETRLKHLFTIAEAKIEVWRTLQANSRAGVG